MIRINSYNFDTNLMRKIKVIKRSAIFLVLILNFILGCYQDTGHAIIKNTGVTPNNENYFEQALVLYKKGHYERAISFIDKALKLNPDYFGALILRGESYRLWGKNEQAIQDYSRAIELDNTIDGIDELFYSRGSLRMKIGDYNNAIKDFTKAIQINPQHVRAYQNRGIVWDEQGYHDFAIIDYNHALSIDPKNAVIYSNRGGSWSDNGEYDKAISDFNKAIKINPNDPEFYYNRGIAWAMKENYERALNDFNHAIKNKYQNPEIFTLRGLVKNEIRDYKGAIDDYNRSLEINSEYAEAYYNLAWLLATSNNAKFRDGAEAVKLAQKSLKLKPQDIDALASLAAAYAETGRFDEAVKTQEQVIGLLKKKDKPDKLAENIKRLNAYESHNPWREK